MSVCFSLSLLPKEAQCKSCINDRNTVNTLSKQWVCVCFINVQLLSDTVKTITCSVDWPLTPPTGTVECWDAMSLEFYVGMRSERTRTQSFVGCCSPWSLVQTCACGVLCFLYYSPLTFHSTADILCQKSPVDCNCRCLTALAKYCWFTILVYFHLLVIPFELNPFW